MLFRKQKTQSTTRSSLCAWNHLHHPRFYELQDTYTLISYGRDDVHALVRAYVIRQVISAPAFSARF